MSNVLGGSEGEKLTMPQEVREGTLEKGHPASLGLVLHCLGG